MKNFSFMVIGLFLLTLGCAQTALKSENPTDATKQMVQQVPVDSPFSEDTSLEKTSIELLDSSKKKIGVVSFEETKKGISFSFESKVLRKGTYELFAMDTCETPKASQANESLASFSSEEGGQYYTEHIKDGIFLKHEGKPSLNGKFILFVKRNVTGKSKYSLLACAKIQI